MIATASASRLPNERFLVCPVEELAGEGVYDAVFSNAVLHWVTDHPLAARNIRRSLKAGGRFVAEFGGYPPIVHLPLPLKGLPDLGQRVVELL